MRFLQFKELTNWLLMLFIFILILFIVNNPLKRNALKPIEQR